MSIAGAIAKIMNDSTSIEQPAYPDFAIDSTDAEYPCYRVELIDAESSPIGIGSVPYYIFDSTSLEATPVWMSKEKSICRISAHVEGNDNGTAGQTVVQMLDAVRGLFDEIIHGPIEYSFIDPETAEDYGVYSIGIKPPLGPVSDMMSIEPFVVGSMNATLRHRREVTKIEVPLIQDVKMNYDTTSEET